MLFVCIFWFIRDALTIVALCHPLENKSKNEQIRYDWLEHKKKIFMSDVCKQKTLLPVPIISRQQISNFFRA